MSSKNNSIKEAIERGVENTYPDKSALEKNLGSKKALSIYLGIDPTGPTLHVGHTVQLFKLRQLQELGHKIVIVIGDFTAQIGDPTDKGAVRKPLTSAQIKRNAKDYKEQIGKILDLTKTTFKNNSKWLGKLGFDDVVKIASHFTAQQTLARDMFRRRIREGKDLYLHEFLYPLMQAYDSVAMNIDMEIGGSDQTFNMLAGRTLMKRMKNKEKFVLTTKLLEDPTGKKMGKTAGNMVALNDSPENMYGKVMSWPDTMIVTAFELITDTPWDDVKKIEEEFKAGGNPKNLKMKLAYVITKIYHDVSGAEKAQKHFQTVFEKKEAPKKIPTVSAKDKNIVSILTQAKLASSKSEARRLLKQNGVKVDDQVVTDENFTVNSGSVVKKGKRSFVKIS